MNNSKDQPARCFPTTAPQPAFFITQSQPPAITLEPLLTNGRNCLVCADVNGLSQATLKKIEYYHGGIPWQCITRSSEDVFVLVEQGLFVWPPLEQLIRAEFDFRVHASRRPEWVAISFVDQLLSCRAEYRDKFENWAVNRGFINPRAYAA